MSNSTGALRGFAAYNRGSSSRKAIPPNVFAGAAGAFGVLGCAWTLYVNVFGASIYPVMAGSGIESAVMSPRPASAKQKSTVALLTAAYSPENAPATFSERLSPLAERLSATPVPQITDQVDSQVDSEVETQADTRADTKLDILADLPKPQNEVPSSPPVVRQAVSIPVPAPRPSELRLLQNKNPSAGELAQRAKATVLANTAADKLNIFEKLFGKTQPSGPMLAYATPDGGVMSDGRDTADSPSAPYDRATAVYDISAHTVYMPDGTRLEAHSGLGSRLDDPRYVRERMRGPTPPHVYDLAPREALFHGVPALRLKPVGGEDAVFGRTGLLAHTYMLGPNGDSNGCVSFRNYDAFLQAYRSQRVKRLVVVAHLD